MFNFDLSLLDYVWRILAFGTVVLSVTYVVGIALQNKIFRINPTHSKKIWRTLYIQVLVVVSIGLGLLALGQKDAINCFETFLQHPSALTITRGLSAAWLLGLVLFVCWDVFNVIKAILASRSWVPVKNNQLQTVADKLKVKLPQIYIQNGHQSPFVFGFFKTVLVLPKAFIEKASGNTTNSVIAHELVHIKDFDIQWNFIELSLRRLFFFHPLVYLAKHLYLDAQEKSADIQAINALQIKKSDFAKGFFEVIQIFKCSNQFAMSASSTTNFNALKSRMNYLANNQVESKQSSTILLFVLGLLVSCTWSYVEARSSLGGRSKNEMGINMCVQVQHEMALEKIFRVKPAEPVRCE